MGKNQQHKSRQLSKHSSSYADAEAPVAGQGVDASFHSAEWHEARLAALQVERPSWEDWRQKQKQDQLKELAALEAQERAMDEYKQGLQADRERRLGLASDKHKKHKKRSREEKRNRTKDAKRERSKKHGKRRKRQTDSNSSGKDTSSDTSESDSSKSKDGGLDRGGPMKLSEYLKD